MNFLKKNQDIIIWGSGKIGSRIIEKISDEYNIRFIVDNKIIRGEKEKIGYFEAYNPSVLQSKELRKDSMIVLCLEQWKKLKGQLDELGGLKIFKDFIPWTLLEYKNISLEFMDFLETDEEKIDGIQLLAQGKKVCAFYGFCHTLQYKNFLNASSEFLEKYIILNLPTVNDTENPFHSILKSGFVWSGCDLFIATWVSELNLSNVPSTQQVLKELKSTCKRILITSASFRGYFPQHTVGIKEVNKYFAWGDKNINKMIKQGLNCENIVREILEGDIYDSEFVLKYFEKSLRSLKKEERKCDVKIADFIEKNGRERPLFYSWTHPVKDVMVEIGKRIFSALELDGSILDGLDDDLIIKMNTNEELIYPCVLKALGVKETDRIIAERKMNPAHVWADHLLTVKEYIEGYVSVNRNYAGGES